MVRVGKTVGHVITYITWGVMDTEILINTRVCEHAHTYRISERISTKKKSD